MDLDLARGVELVPVETPAREFFEVEFWRPGIEIRADASGVKFEWQVVAVGQECAPPSLIDRHFGVHQHPIEIKQNRRECHAGDHARKPARGKPKLSRFFVRIDWWARQIGGVITTRGIVVRLTKLTDTSLIAHWFTVDAGLLKTVARGARRPRSAFAGKLDLFFGCEISVARSRNGTLDTLREVALEQCRDGLRRSWPATLMAGYFCRLCEAVVEPGHPDAEMFDLLRRGLDHLEAQPPTLRAMRHFEAEVARCLGISSHPGQAEAALRESLGALPANRARILDLLSPPGA